ncbi:MAG: hypothetical protein LBR36_08105 [Bacteroidales bacterium]|nr:hypothetical protein [Bacteroidales bacterium]
MISKIVYQYKHIAHKAIYSRYDFRYGTILSHNSEKHAIAMQLTDYQAFTPPPNALIISELCDFEAFVNTHTKGIGGYAYV